MRKFHTSVLLALGFVVLAGILPASQVFHHPRPSDELASRWNWAVEKAQTQGLKDGCWIGYSIKRLMGEYTYFASNGTYTFSSSYHYPSFFRGKSLGEIVYGYKFAPEVSDEEQIKKIAKTHPKLKVRKSAIYCLGDSDDSRALNALIEIIRKK